MKRYFIWKDGLYNGENTEWQEINGKEFYELTAKPENKQRRFITVPVQEENGDEFHYEATAENYQKWHADYMRELRLKNYKIKHPIEFVSLDAPVAYDEDEVLTLADILPDTTEEDLQAEEEYAEWHKKALDSIKASLTQLSPEERKVIDLIYLDNPSQKSEVELAKELGISQQLLNYRKRQVIKKIRRIVGESICRN